MTPNDYKRAAYKHLLFCEDWKGRYDGVALMPKEHELLEIYYLAGYIAECLTIYTIYAIGGWNPTGIVTSEPKMIKKIKKTACDLDIESFFDPVFTHYTEYDYYQNSYPSAGRRGCKVRSVYRKIVSSGNHTVEGSGELQEMKIGAGCYYLWKRIEMGININTGYALRDCICTDYGTYISENELKAKFYVSNHGFQDAINYVILGKIGVNEGVNTLKFFEDLKKEREGSYKLLAKWKPGIRYYSKKESLGEDLNPLLNKANIINLIGELRDFYNAIDKI